MRRRAFMTLVGGTVTWPFSASAQSRASRPLIAILVGISPMGASPLLKAFAQQMKVLGRIEGRDYDTAVRFADGDLARFPELASEVVGLKPDIVVSANTTAAVAAKKATSTIPIVSIALIEPIERGLVASHAHPGGNLTGILISLDTLLGKQLQIATELLPGAKKGGLLVNVHSASSAVQRPDAERVAAALRLELVVIDVATRDQVEPAIRQLARNEIDIAIIPTDPLFLTERQRIAADLVDRILNGTAPAEIPVELPSKLELVINLKAAKTLGLEVPAALIARADEVME